MLQCKYGSGISGRIRRQKTGYDPEARRLRLGISPTAKPVYPFLRRLPFDTVPEPSPTPRIHISAGRLLGRRVQKRCQVRL